MKYYLLVIFFHNFFFLIWSHDVLSQIQEYINDIDVDWFRDENGTVHRISLRDNAAPKNDLYNPDEEIEYYVYSRKTPNMGQRIYKGDNNSISTSFLDVKKPVIMTIHGWTGDLTSPVNVRVRTAFLSVQDVNVIVVNWSKGSSRGYREAVDNVPPTGESIGRFLDWLNSVGVPFEKMHVIGHSLGGQLAGFVCRSCKKGRVGYLTSLDPAHPSWDANSDRIRKTDAKYVEVIHTNVGRLGMMDPAGHNDFYPNGGLNMPGCAGSLACSHAKCVDYFAESIDHRGFIGNICETVSDATTDPRKCSSTKRLHMGGASAKTEYGLFSLETNDESPYHKG